MPIGDTGRIDADPRVADLRRGRALVALRRLAVDVADIVAAAREDQRPPSDVSASTPHSACVRLDAGRRGLDALAERVEGQPASLMVIGAVL